MHGHHELEMTMWAQNTSVANMARDHQHELHQQLKDSQFHLRKLQIIDGTDPYELDMSHDVDFDFHAQGPHL